MKKVGTFIGLMLFFLIGISNVKALKVGTCDVLVYYKANSSLDNDTYICKGQKFGESTDSIYYSGSGNKIVLNDFNAYYFSLAGNVVLDVNNSNSISLLHSGEYTIEVTGTGNIKFKEDSYVKKVNNGELVYNYLYQGKTIIKSEKLIYEGTIKEFVSDYKELAELNNLPTDYVEENFEMVQAIDFVSMTPVSITEEWLTKHIITKLNAEVENGYGLVKYVEKKEDNKDDDNKTLVSDKVILVSEKKFNSKDTLNVYDLSEEIDKYDDQVSEYDILSLYDLSVYNGDKLVVMKNGHYTVKIKMDDNSIDNYHNYKIIYVDNGGKVAEYIDGVIENGYIVFTTTHLSQYGVVAEAMKVNEVVNDNSLRNTITSIVKYGVLISFSLVSIILIIFLIIKSGLLKKKKRRA